MLRIKLPRKTHNWTIAISGGVDSMTLASFILNGGHKFNAVHFNHRTPKASEYEEFVSDWCKNNNINLTTYYYSGPNTSEKDWAAWRTRIMYGISGYVLTAHHLDDRLESYLMGMNLLYNVGNIYRPMLASKKVDILKFAQNWKIKWVEDPTNEDPDFCRRNKIRNVLIPTMRDCGINPYSFLES